MSGAATQPSRQVATGRVQIRTATADDNEGLLTLTRLAPMKGRIALRIDRDPDFFSLLRHRGEGALFVAARGDEVVASFAVTIRDVYVGGRAVHGAYIADLKVTPSAAGTRVVPRLIEAVLLYLHSHDVDLVWCVVAAGNDQVMPLLAGRLGIPQFVPVGRFVVDELLNLPFVRSKRSEFIVDEMTPSDEEEVLALRDRFHRTRQLSPVRDAQISDGTIARLVARSASRIVASLELFNPERLKQNVLLGAPMSTRVVLSTLRPVSAMLGGPHLPRIEEAIRLAYIRRFACEPQHEAALTTLLGRARSIALKHGFTFTSIALHERDPLRSVVGWMPRFTFSSLLYIASLRHAGALELVTSGVPVQDYSLV